MLKFMPFGLAAALLAGCATGPSKKPNPSAAPARGVQITEQADRLRIEVNGRLFTEYFFKDVPRPYYYPLLGPGDIALTRNWPMLATTNEEHDHPHHRSLWFAHGTVNGQDFWSEAKQFGKIVHTGFSEIKSGKDLGVVRSRDEWVTADGTVICNDERTFRVYRPTSAGEQLFDFEITLHPANGDLVMGDTKEGAMAVRLAENLRLKGNAGRSHIVTSSGDRDEKTWGKRADWCDYNGVLEGKTVGIAMFDHPQNPRHPTWWHVRDYGLFAANPFGQHDFEKLADKSAGDFTIPLGKSVTFRYRFYLHNGDEQQAKVATKYAEYVNSHL